GASLLYSAWMECGDTPADSPSFSDDEADYDYDDFYCNGENCGMEIFEREDPEYIEYVCLKVPEVCIIKLSAIVINIT
ncbi:hypothetical protein WUBG_14250, partial [Wuchereria bancrofti]